MAPTKKVNLESGENAFPQKLDFDFSHPEKSLSVVKLTPITIQIPIPIKNQSRCRPSPLVRYQQEQQLDWGG